MCCHALAAAAHEEDGLLVRHDHITALLAGLRGPGLVCELSIVEFLYHRETYDAISGDDRHVDHMPLLACCQPKNVSP